MLPVDFSIARAVCPAAACHHALPGKVNPVKKPLTADWLNQGTMAAVNNKNKLPTLGGGNPAARRSSSAASRSTSKTEFCKGVDAGSPAGPASSMVTAGMDEGLPAGSLPPRTTAEEIAEGPSGERPPSPCEVLDLSPTGGELEERDDGVPQRSPPMESTNEPPVVEGGTASGMVRTEDPLPRREPRSCGPPATDRIGLRPEVSGPGISGAPLPSPELNMDCFRNKRRLERSSSDDAKPELSPAVRGNLRGASGITISDESELECTVLIEGDKTGSRPYSFRSTPALAGRKSSLPKRKGKRGRFESSPDAPFDDVPDVDVESMPAVELGGVATQWLTEIDSLRKKSTNLQGRVSGQMRVRLRRTRDVIQVLTTRAEARGDLQHLRAKNVSLSESLYSEKKKSHDLQKEIAFLEDKMGKMQTELRALKEKVQLGAPERSERPGCSADAPPLASTSSGGPGKPVGEKEIDLAAYLEVARGVDERMSGLMRFLDDLRGDPLRFRKFLLDGNTGVGSPISGAPPETKKKPRVVSDVRVAPPRRASREDCTSPAGEGESGAERGYPWSLVEGTRKKGANKRRGRIRSAGSGTMSGGAVTDTSASLRATRGRPSVVDPDPHPSSYAEAARRPRTGPPASRVSRAGGRRRVPRSAAVAIRPVREGLTLEEIMTRAKSGVSLGGLGIHESRVRRTANGSLLIEVSDADGVIKADRLAHSLKEIFGGEAAVTRPSIKSELRLVGLDVTTTAEDIRTALIREGDNSDDLKVGPIRSFRNGLGTAWLQCPVSIADRILQQGRVTIGWSTVRVESLGPKPTQCYKCWSFGHVRGTCGSATDRTGSCFRCGQPGHIIRDCRFPVKCVLCAELGLGPDHRLGSTQCGARNRVARGTRAENPGPL